MTQIERYDPTQNGAVATVQPTHAGLAMSFQDMRQRVRLLDEFYKDVMQTGTDYGVIPGTPKPTLLQPGAQLLDAIFGLVPKFEELEGTVRDYDKGFFAYEIRCALINKATGEVAAEGIGSCNSMEGRYRWRESKPTCPQCGFDLRVSNRDPEWYCWKAKGGCGATYPLDQIKGGGKVENDDPYTLANTILKMAQKRAHVAATLNATGASRIFTQDVEDMVAEPPHAAPEQRTVHTEVIERAQAREIPGQKKNGGPMPVPTPDFDMDWGQCMELWEARGKPIKFAAPPKTDNLNLLAGWHTSLMAKLGATESKPEPELVTAGDVPLRDEDLPF